MLRHSVFPASPAPSTTIGCPSESGIAFTTTSNSKWRVSVTKAPILNAEQMERIASSEALQVPYPEMFFGFNKLSVVGEDVGLQITFSAVDALKHVEHGTTEAMESVKVAISKEWTEKSEKLHGKIKKIAKPYDWTYTPKAYNGSVGGANSLKFQNTQARINIDMLKRNEPILWYDEVVLYEDELADNGACMLTARVRVMPSCFLVLLRFFLRVDNVLFRIHDTRLFHDFNSEKIIRETSTRECSYNRVLGKVPGGGYGPSTAGRDLSLLNKADWVAQGMVDPLGIEVTTEGVLVDGVTVTVTRDEINITKTSPV
ncbi:TIP41-like family-domain-containing protein [Obelidium mucronatum]|nr:TIP41-like family-domain-containing protein [Obelidium mucronatum]